MKKSVLVLLTFVPLIVGHIINISIRIPVIGMIIFYVLPLLTTVFWFYLGRQYARSTWKIIPALFIGNATGVVSLLIYLWQYLFKTDETRNVVLMSVAQMFSDATPTYLLGRIAILFETQPNYIASSTFMVALNVISFVYIVVVFLFGFIWEKKTKKM